MPLCQATNMNYHSGNDISCSRKHQKVECTCVSDGACAHMMRPMGVFECQQMLFLYSQWGPQPKQLEAEKRWRRKRIRAREGDRLRKNGEGKRGRACMCPCGRSLVQQRHCHYQSLSAALNAGV